MILKGIVSTLLMFVAIFAASYGAWWTTAVFGALSIWILTLDDDEPDDDDFMAA